MFRPNKMTYFREWLARLIMPKTMHSVDLSKLDTTKLSELEVSTEQEYRPSSLLNDVFKGAPDEFIYNLSFYIGDAVTSEQPTWDKASLGIPERLTPMGVMRTEWVLWYEDGKVAIIELPRTGSWDNSGKYFNHHPTTIPPMLPDGVIRAAKVGTLGVNEGGGTCTCRWELYAL